MTEVLILGGKRTPMTEYNGVLNELSAIELGSITRALSRVESKNPKFPILTNALVTLGRGDGWGSTNANASALLALSELLQPPFLGASRQTVEVRWNADKQSVTIGPDQPVGYAVSTLSDAGEVALKPGGSGPVVIRAETIYVPAADGSQTAAKSDGFVVTRDHIRITKEDDPSDRTILNTPGLSLDLAVGDVVEDHVQIVNPKDRNYVAVVVPLAAGMEPLNPVLATAPPEAKTKGQLTRTPSYASFLDDRSRCFLL